MAKINVPFFTSRPRKNGTHRYFWQPSAALRAHGFKLKRLSDDEATAITECKDETERVKNILEARAAGAEASAEMPAPQKRSSIHPDSVEAMVRAFKKSDEYKLLSAKSLKEYETGIAALLSWAGDQPKAAITRGMTKQWIKELSVKTVTRKDGKTIIIKRPAGAKAIGRVARRIFYWGMDATGKDKTPEQEAANPFARIGLSYKRANIKDPDQLLWSDDAIAAFVATADQHGMHSIGTAIMMDAWLGQRLGDVIAWPHDFDEDLRYRQSKRGRNVILPIGIVPHLVKRVEEERARIKARQDVTRRCIDWMNARGRKAWPRDFEGQPFVPTQQATTLLISEATGLPYNTDHFGKRFKLLRDAVAALYPDRKDWHKLTFQRLRATAITRLGEADCQDEQIAAVSGHSLSTVKQILEFYLVRTRKMAVNAFKKRLAAEQGEG